MRAWLAAVLLGLATACSSTPAPPRYPAERPVHRVAAGETLYGIARRYGTDVATLVRLNGLDDANTLAVGQPLYLPAGTEAPPEPEVPIAPREADPVLACNAHVPAPEGEISKSGFGWPVDGVILTRFGQWEGAKHEGLAIAAPLGSPVWAAADGEVILIGAQPGYGQLVVVRHANGWLSLYGSLERACVQSEGAVRRGQLLGLVGTTSGVASPRLYFELRGPKGPVDPRPRLP